MIRYLKGLWPGWELALCYCVLGATAVVLTLGVYLTGAYEGSRSAAAKPIPRCECSGGLKPAGEVDKTAPQPPIEKAKTPSHE